MKNLFEKFEDTHINRAITILSAAALLLLFLAARPYYSAKTQIDRFSSTLLQTVAETGEVEESTARLLDEFYARNGWQPQVNWQYGGTVRPNETVTLEVTSKMDMEFLGGLFHSPMFVISRTTGAWEWVAD